MRLIDADALYMELSQEAAHRISQSDGSRFDTGRTNGIICARDSIKSAPTINPVRWISVSERLPDDVGSYLIYYHEWSNGDFLPKYDDYRIRVMRFMNNGKWCMPVCTDKRYEADTNREVTHWMHLPDPPRKDDEA